MSPSTRSAAEAGPSRTRSTRRSVLASSSTDRLDQLISPAKETRLTRTTNTTSTTVTASPRQAVGARVSNKGKEKEDPVQVTSIESRSTGAQSSSISKRVLPARLRRAAGGGQDGIRDLEEMIVDWLDRYGCPSDSPPDNLQVTITSLPMSMVDPPTYSAGSDTHTEAVTITPAVAGPSTERSVIETPDWILVKAGEDDQEEAREELSARTTISPVRRLRRLSIGEDHAEDTSDEHYIRLHKKYEAFEKRQRKDERDKLAFERYKMRTRIDLLKGMSVSAWSAVVWSVMAREDTSGHWAKGKEKVKVQGVDWLRRRLVREGEEVMKRYDQLLPHDPRKARLLDSRNSTPTPSVGSTSPPPAVLPARVAALKDTAILQRRRSLPSQLNGGVPKRKRQLSEVHGSQPKRATPGRSPARAQSDSGSDTLTEPPSEHEDESTVGNTPAMTPSEPASASPAPSIVSAVTKPVRKGTRASTRNAPAHKTATRTSARLSQPGSKSEPTESSNVVMSNGHNGIPTEQAHRRPSVDLPRQLRKSLDRPFDPFFQTPLPRIEISPDEQLEMDRVEAAVVI